MTAVRIALRRSIPKISSSSCALTRAAARRRAASSSVRSTARRAASPSARAVAGGEREQLARAGRASVGASPVANDVEVPELRRVLRGDARRRPRRGPEWSATSGGHAGGGSLGRDHAERLGEDRRHDGDVGERQQVHEVPVLERPGEERAAAARCASSSSR